MTQVRRRVPQPLRTAFHAARYPFGVTASSLFNPPRILRTWVRVNRHRLTYAKPEHIQVLVKSIARCERERVPGEIIEAGCALGGTSIVLCAAKSQQRPMRIFDVFGMIPEPSDHDGSDMAARYKEIAAGESSGIGGDRYYAYDDDLMRTVEFNFERLGFPLARNNVSMTKGKAEDTLVVDGPVMFANVDIDWYAPVTACLERVTPHLSPGGCIFVRAYGDWSGTKRATDEFFDKYGHHDLEFSEARGALLIRRRLEH